MSMRMDKDKGKNNDEGKDEVKGMSMDMVKDKDKDNNDGKDEVKGMSMDIVRVSVRVRELG